MFIPPKVTNKLITGESLAHEEFIFYLQKIKNMMEPGCKVTVMVSHPTDASKHLFVSEEDNHETCIHKMQEIIKRHTAPKIELDDVK